MSTQASCEALCFPILSHVDVTFACLVHKAGVSSRCIPPQSRHEELPNFPLLHLFTRNQMFPWGERVQIHIVDNIGTTCLMLDCQVYTSNCTGKTGYF